MNMHKIKQIQIYGAVVIALVMSLAWATAQAEMLQGTVQKIDKDKITLKTNDGNVTVELDDATKGADQAKVGDKVKINASRSGGKVKASDIITDDKASPANPPAGGSSNRPLVPGGSLGR